MKKKLQNSIFILLLFLGLTSSYAQNLSCNNVFMDNGGTNNYLNNTDATVTICPTIPNEKVSVTFTLFDTEINFDGLYIFNGSSIASPQISSSNPAANVPGGLAGAFWGNQLQGVIITSTAPDGCLTFRFRSDNSGQRAGWVANIICGNTSACSQPLGVVANNLTLNSATINWSAMGNTSWEVFHTTNTTFIPTATTVGTVVSTNTHNLTGLLSNTNYRAFVRTICSNGNKTNWTSSNIFKTLTCAILPQISSTNTTQSYNFTINPVGSQFEYIFQLASLPVPSPTTTGTSLNVNTLSINKTGLLCGTMYRLYVRSKCVSDNTFSEWANNQVNTPCVLTNGAAQNFNQCAENSTPVCFNLTLNNNPILGTTPPTDLEITYYLTQSNAELGTNPITAHCISNQSVIIYNVVKKISTGEKQFRNFTITSFNYNLINLPNMTACDNNFDGLVVFNVATNFTPTQVLTYHNTQNEAISGANPLTINPAQVSLTAGSPAVTYFIREVLVGCDNIYKVTLIPYLNCNLAYVCSQANQLCNALGVPFNNTAQGVSAETGNNYGCLATTPNPTWFYIPVSQSGTIKLNIKQNTTVGFNGNPLDVDYIVYGPFSNTNFNCGSLNNLVSCSYSAAATETATITNAVAGQYYLLMTTNFSNQNGFIIIDLDPTSTGDINCSGIRLNAFLDSNANGVKDTGEQNFPLGQFHYIKNNDNVVHNITSPLGIYNIFDTNNLNSYDVSYTIDPAYTSFYNLTTSSYADLTVVTGGGMSTYFFPVTITSPYQDVGVVIVPTIPRAGAFYNNKIVYANLGNQIIPSGTISYQVAPATTINTVTPAGAVMTTTGFTFNYTNLLPFQVRTIDVKINVPTIPTVSIGQLLTNSVNISPTQNDVQLSNNTFASTQGIVAAYDPNDKMESRGEKVLFSSFNQNDYLNYTIRFENTGNASALKVVIKDLLDPKIDENTIVMQSSSHNYVLDRVNRQLVWTFDNIQLPPSVADTEIGKGYVSFKVKLKPGFQIGTIIPNTAEIYFDTNPPIITNTFETEFFTTLSSSVFDDLSFGLYPNPAKNDVTVRLSNSNDEIDSVVVYDVLGKVIYNQSNIKSNSNKIEVSSWNRGIYIVEVKDNNKRKEVKKLVLD